MASYADKDDLGCPRFALGHFLGGERDYEIRFLKADGATALVFVTSCASDEHAGDTARSLMRDDFAAFEIWRGHHCVTKES
jgi:hypothetical protein